MEYVKCAIVQTGNFSNKLTSCRYWIGLADIEIENLVERGKISVGPLLYAVQRAGRKVTQSGNRQSAVKLNKSLCAQLCPFEI